MCREFVFKYLIHCYCLHYEWSVKLIFECFPLHVWENFSTPYFILKTFLCFVFFFVWFFRGRNLSDCISEANPWSSWGRYDQTTQCWADWCEANCECRQCSQTVLPVIWKPTGSVQLNFSYKTFRAKRKTNTYICTFKKLSAYKKT